MNGAGYLFPGRYICGGERFSCVATRENGREALPGPCGGGSRLGKDLAGRGEGSANNIVNAQVVYTVVCPGCGTSR